MIRETVEKVITNPFRGIPTGYKGQSGRKCQMNERKKEITWSINGKDQSSGRLAPALGEQSMNCTGNQFLQ
jgi:hypothetical protein